MPDSKPSVSWLPDRTYWRELRRPWKLITFALGMGWLFYGALVYRICDWDLGITVIMGSLTYLFAPWSVITIYRSLRLRAAAWPLHIAAALLPALLTVDWVYWIYHSLVGNQMLRWDNFKVSTVLYFICGIVWCYPGSLQDLVRNFRLK